LRTTWKTSQELAYASAELSAGRVLTRARVESEHFQNQRTVAVDLAVCAIVRSASIVKKEMF
jgi:hypothetical protein